MRMFGVPFWFILPILGLPLALIFITRNPFWIVLVFVLAYAGRSWVSGDHNAPRVLFLSVLSGATFADRSWRGSDSFDPLGPSVHAEDPAALHRWNARQRRPGGNDA